MKRAAKSIFSLVRHQRFSMLVYIYIRADLKSVQLNVASENNKNGAETELCCRKCGDDDDKLKAIKNWNKNKVRKRTNETTVYERDEKMQAIARWGERKPSNRTLYEKPNRQWHWQLINVPSISLLYRRRSIKRNNFVGGCFFWRCALNDIEIIRSNSVFVCLQTKTHRKANICCKFIQTPSCAPMQPNNYFRIIALLCDVKHTMAMLNTREKKMFDCYSSLSYANWNWKNLYCWGR